MSSNLGILTLLAGALSAAALAFAPVAAASPESFIDELNTNKVWLPQKTPEEVIGAGYETCSDLTGGTPVLDEMTAVEQRYNFDQGTLFVSAATTHLCPDFAAG
jgi:Protein of unknown function (DUF732)